MPERYRGTEYLLVEVGDYVSADRLIVHKKGENSEAKRGQVETYSEAVAFELGDAQISFVAKNTGNGVAVSCLDVSSSRFIPTASGKERISTRWQDSFGEPGNIQKTFGVPEWLLRAVFLGHPDRDQLLPFFDKQRKSYNYELETNLEAEGNLSRVVVWTSPPFPSIFDALDDPYQEGQPLAHSFEGEGIALGEIGYYPDLPGGGNLRISVVTKSAKDSAVRIERGRWLPLPARTDSSVRARMLTRFAVTGIYFQGMGSLGRLNSPDAFPLPLVHGLTEYIYDPKLPPRKQRYKEGVVTLAKGYDNRFTTERVVGSQKAQLVEDETKRLKAILARLKA